MKTRVVPVLVTLVALAVGRAGATVVIAPTFDEMVAKARYVFLGEVMARDVQSREGPSGRAIHTMVTFKVLEPVKGVGFTETVLEFLGGEVGGLGLRVEGMPTFNVGDRDILFVHGDRNTASPLVGFMHGRLRVLKDEGGREFVASYNGRALGSVAALGPAVLPRGHDFSRAMTVREMIGAIRLKIDEQLRRQ